MENFVFFSANYSFGKVAATIITVDPTLPDEHALFGFYTEALRFPRHFGRNWHAFKDCLCNVFCVGEEGVALVHEHLPNLDTAELCLYIGVLHAAVSTWIDYGDERLFVFFDNSLKEQVEHLFAEYKKIL